MSPAGLCLTFGGISHENPTYLVRKRPGGLSTLKLTFILCFMLVEVVGVSDPTTNTLMTFLQWQKLIEKEGGVENPPTRSVTFFYYSPTHFKVGDKMKKGERNKSFPHQILQTERGLDPSQFNFFSKLEIGLKPSKSRLLRNFIFALTSYNLHVTHTSKNKPTRKVQSPSRYKFKLFLRRVFFRSLSWLKINMFSLQKKKKKKKKKSTLR
eukprot:TRINITY_DN5758_c0_g1_i3.p1 TRINITY_DN5758_c0_g1~~TRINITY_DN5758_c0_g1_i3.p1  ORF type:complete len:210 (+),score=27.00 TRINITY_DN5758_c0_g1_i3:97-726(+)